MRQLCLWGLLLALVRPALALEEADLAQLVPLEQTELPRLVVDRLAWLPDGRHVVMGGWLEWPDAPIVAAIPNDLPALQAGAQAASPRFAIAPDGSAVAFWKKVRIGQQDRAELNLVRLDSQMVSTLGEPVEISSGLHLVWLPGGPIVYGTEEAAKGTAQLWAADLTGGKPRSLLSLQGAAWQDLTASPDPGVVIARCTGGEQAAYAVNAQTGQYAPLGRGSRATPAPDGSGRSLEIDAEGALILNVSATEGVIVDRGVRAAQWRPDGQAVLYVKDHTVGLTNATGTVTRSVAQLTDKEANTFLRGCVWAPDGVSVAYWGAVGATGRAWRASLGQEAVTARFSFPREAPVKAGQRVWVVSKYQTDAFGRIIEPVWKTLKGCFVVTRILRTPEGTVAEAASSGQESGVVERVAGAEISNNDDSGHIRIGLEGQLATAWTRTRTLRFREGLRGWLEKTSFDSQPLSLSVERHLLPAIGEAK